MAQYCSADELTNLTGTPLSTTILNGIIDQSDRKIKSRIKRAGLSPAASDDDLKAASLELSKAGIITHNRMTGTQTKSIKVGDIAIQDDIDVAIAGHMADAWESVDAYIVRNTGCPIPIMAIVGRRGQRIGEHEEMTESQEDVY